MCGEVGTQVGLPVPLVPSTNHPGPSSLFIPHLLLLHHHHLTHHRCIGASKTLLVHRQLFVPEELVVGSCVKMVQLVHWRVGVRSVPQKILVAKAVNLIHSHPQHRMIDPAPSRSLWIQFCTKYPEYPIQGNAIDQGYRFIKVGI